MLHDQHGRMNDPAGESVWLRTLTPTELLALVRYGGPLLRELGPMHQAGVLRGVVELGDAFTTLRAALASGSSDDTVPAVRLGPGTWVVLARHVRKAAQRLAVMSVAPALRSPYAALRRLYREASSQEHHILVCGADDASLPTSSPDELDDEVRRTYRQLTLREDRLLHAALHSPEAGLASESASERWRAFVDLSDVLVPHGRLHPAAVDELDGLFVPLMSGQPGKHQAALLLGLVAAAMGGSTTADVDRAKVTLLDNLRALGADLSSGDWPGVLDEATPAARVCLALAAVRAGFADGEIVDALPERARPAVRRAVASQGDGYSAAVELALQVAQSES